MIKKFGQQSKCMKVAIIIMIFLSSCFYLWLAYFLFSDHVGGYHFIGGDKCPACYGKTLCPKIHSGIISVGKEGLKAHLLMLLNVKNIHFGTYKGQGPVVMKMLGHDKELANLDKEICRLAEEAQGCDVTRAVHKLPVVKSRELNPRNMKGMSDLMTCPSQRLISLMLQRYVERGPDPRVPTMTLEGRLHLMTTLLINPEPLIMQVSIFPHTARSLQRSIPLNPSDAYGTAFRNL